MVLSVEDVTDQVLAEMTAVKFRRGVALRCSCRPVFVLTQAIAGIEGFKRDVLNDNFPACMCSTVPTTASFAIKVFSRL